MNTRTFRDAGLIEPLEARIAPARAASDLVAIFQSITINGVVNPTTIVPGDSGEITVLIQNFGPAPVVDVKTCLNIWLTPNTKASYGTLENKIVDGLKDILQKNVAVFNPASPGTPGNPADGSYFVTKKFTVPNYDPTAVPDPTHNATGQDYLMPGKYRIVGEIDGAAESDTGDFSFVSPRHNNNFAASPEFDYAFKFGTFPGHKNDSLTIDGSTGVAHKFFLTGGGAGELKPTGVAGQFDLVFTGTNATSVANKAAAKNLPAAEFLTLRNITADAPMKQLTMFTNLDVTGDVTLNGIAALHLGNIGGAGKSVSLGGVAGVGIGAKVELGHVTDLDIAAPAGLDKLEVADWTNPNADPDVITAPFINSLGSDGDFAATLTLNGANAKGVTLSKAIIGGALSNAVWTLQAPGNANDINADSASDWRLLADGSVGDLYIAHDFDGVAVHVAANPDVKAKFFGTVTIGGGFNGLIKATGDNNKVAIAKLSISSALSPEIIADTGGILKVDVGEWLNGGGITAKWIKKLSTDGLFVTTPGDFSANLALAGGPDTMPKGIKASLGSASIAGAITGGAWFTAGDIDSITAFRTASSWSLIGGGANSLSVVGKLTVKNDLAGSLLTRGFKSVNVGGELSATLSAGSVDATGLGGFIDLINAKTVDNADIFAAQYIEKIAVGVWKKGKLKTEGIDSLKIAGDFMDTTLDFTGSFVVDDIIVGGTMSNIVVTAGGAHIKQIKAGQWIGGSVAAKSLGSLTITGAGALRGDLQNVTLNLTGGDVTSLGLLNVAGLADHVTINLAKGAGKLGVGAMISSTIAAAGQDLREFVVKGIAGLAGPQFNASNINALGIAKVIVHDVNDAVTSNYGITADRVANYTRYVGKTKISALKFLDAPGTPDSARNFVLTIT